MSALAVRDIMSIPVVTIPIDDTVHHAVEQMVTHRIGGIVAIDGERPVGIFTERDLLNKVIAAGRDPVSTKIREVLTPVLNTIAPDRSPKTASKMMLARKGCLVVMDGDEMLGIVAASDLMRALSATEMKTPALSQAMTKRVFMVDHQTSTEEAVRIMRERRIGSVLVTRDGEPFGIFTERDLLVRVMPKRENLRRPVGEFASTPITTAQPNIDVQDAARIMAKHRIKRLPIFDGGKPIGIITARDIVEAYSLLP